MASLGSDRLGCAGSGRVLDCPELINAAHHPATYDLVGSTQFCDNEHGAHYHHTRSYDDAASNDHDPANQSCYHYRPCHHHTAGERPPGHNYLDRSEPGV